MNYIRSPATERADRRKKPVVTATNAFIRVKPKPMKCLPMSERSDDTATMSHPSSPLIQDRVSMLVTEANEISKYLQRDYVFSKLGDNSEDDGNNVKVIRVTNRRLSMHCMWTVAKLKERLVRMRKLVYSKDDSIGGIGMETVFFDPADDWEKDVESQAFRIVEGAELKEKSGAHEVFPKEQEKTPMYDQPSLDYKPSTALASMMTSQANVFLASSTIASQYSVPNVTSLLDSNYINGKDVGSPSVNSEPDIKRINDTAMNGSAVIMNQELINESSFLRLSSSWPVDEVTSPTSTLYSQREDKSEKSSKGDVISTFVPDTVKPKSASHRRRCHRRVQTSPNLFKNRPNSMLSACRVIIKQTSRKLQEIASCHHKPPDIVLASCEYLKMALVSILEIYVQTHENHQHENLMHAFCKVECMQDSSVRSHARLIKVSLLCLYALSGSFNTLKQVKAVLSDYIEISDSSHLLHHTCCNVAATISLLLTYLSSWTDLLAGLNSVVLDGLSSQLTTLATQLSDQVTLFLQSYEDNNDTAVSECGAQVIEVMFELLRCCGKLCLATETQPQLLNANLSSDELSSSSSHSDAVIHVPGEDVRQAFLDGCDQGLNHNFQEAIKFFIDFEEASQSLLKNGLHFAKQADEKIVGMVKSTMLATRTLVETCRQQQLNLNAEMNKDDTVKPKNFFENYFCHCKQMNVNINSLIDFASLLKEAFLGYCDSKQDAGNLSKLCRCSEMLRKTTAKFTETSDKEVIWYLIQNKNVTSSVPIERPLSARTQPSHLVNRSPVAKSAQEVIAILDILIVNVKEKLTLENVDTIGKVRRLLPVTPGRGRPMVRAQSARNVTRLQAVNIN